MSVFPFFSPTGGFDTFAKEFPEMCTKSSPPQGLSLPLSSSRPETADPSCSPCNTPLYDQVCAFSLSLILKQTFIGLYDLAFSLSIDETYSVLLLRAVQWRSCLSSTWAVPTTLQGKTCWTCSASPLSSTSPPTAPTTSRTRSSTRASRWRTTTRPTSAPGSTRRLSLLVSTWHVFASFRASSTAKCEAACHSCCPAKPIGDSDIRPTPPSQPIPSSLSFSGVCSGFKF